MYLPRDLEKHASHSEPPDPRTQLAALVSSDPGSLDRALLVEAPLAALSVRLDMIDRAEHSLDAQYFIWQNDLTGVLMVEHLLEAADRGVRVRALLDDIQLKGLAGRLHALSRHPNVEIRIFNPFSVNPRYQLGLIRLAEFAIDGIRLNHRMHNKLLVADNQVAILGGRNVGDDYFGVSEERNFVDSDVLLAGDVVSALSEGFDDYWNSRWAYPVEGILEIPPMPADLDRLRQRVHRRLDTEETARLVQDLPSGKAILQRLALAPPLESARVLVDEPDVSWFDRPDEIARQLTEVALSAERDVIVVSPYLVLTPGLLDIARQLIAKGVTITVLTNSLASNDVVLAHAAYARYRHRLLDAGIRLFEFREDSVVLPPPEGGYDSLHSKFIVFDDDVVFIGSMNLDPRSLYLNTELGVVLRSRHLARDFRAEFAELAGPDSAWRVVTAEDGLEWQSSRGILNRQPARNAWQRARAGIYSLLPLSNQL